MFRRRSLVIAVAAAALVFQGCSAAARSHARPGADVTGVWVGSSIANCTTLFHQSGRCLAQQKIGFTLLQDKSEVSGFYSCGYGNQNCLNEDERGRVVAASMEERLLSMRVMMDDGMDCIFNGIPLGDRLGGAYICLQGAGIMEKGRWAVQRSY
jgi:hypothetical protein